jgi:hypothetical protein
LFRLPSLRSGAGAVGEALSHLGAQTWVTSELFDRKRLPRPATSFRLSGCMPIERAGDAAAANMSFSSRLMLRRPPPPHRSRERLNEHLAETRQSSNSSRRT